MEVRLELNGEPRVWTVEPQTLLLDALREAGLTGTKEGCGVGVCGLCTVLVDEAPRSACLTLAAVVDGCRVWTAEGISRREPALARAFMEREGMQCGICTPGQLVMAASLRGQPAVAADEEALRRYLNGNLCRCTGYGTIVEAVRAAYGAL
jgi:aerobic-type carbon monoxide dehydrogenase small subunit (CoxS/CutS family)